MKKVHLKKRIVSAASAALLAVTTVFSANMMTKVVKAEDSSKVSFTKVATPVEGQDNTWDITLTIEGENARKTSAVVFVIDRSNSMSESNYMDPTRKAASSAIDSLLKNNDNTQVAVVSYGTDVTNSSFYTKNTVEDAKKYVNNIKVNSTNGGTNIQAGLKKAEDLLAGVDADQKTIVFMTDGQPTYAYKISEIACDSNVTTKFTCKGNKHSMDASLKDESKYTITAIDYNKTVGAGDTSKLDNQSVSTHINCTHGVDVGGTNAKNLKIDNAVINATKYEANVAKAAGYTIYGITLGSLSNTGKDVMNSVVSSSDKLVSASASNITDVYNQIAGKIMYAASNTKVTDKITDKVGNFILDESTPVRVSQGDQPVFDEATNTFTWNPGNISGTATMTYRIKVNPEKLSDLSEDEKYPTNNGETKISYTDNKGEEHKEEIPSKFPEVVIKNEYEVKVSYVFEDGSKAADDKTENVVYGHNYSIPTDAKTGYTASETTVSGTMGMENVEKKVTFVPNDYKLTIDYVDENGKKLQDSTDKTVKYDSSYTVTGNDIPSIEGYSTETTKIEGKMDSEGKTEQVVYKKNSYDVTVHYVYEDGSKAADDKTAKVAFQDTYSIDTDAKTGYTADVAKVSGTMGAKPVETTVTYKINKHTVTVNYQYETANGEIVALGNQKVSDTKNYNEKYSYTTKDMDGYTPDTAVVSGTMGDEDVNVTVTYKPNTYKLTINYVFTGDSSKNYNETKDVVYMKGYTVPVNTVEGYTPDYTTVSGTMDKVGGKEVTVTYTPNKYTVTVNYKYENGAKAADSYINKEAVYNTTYSVESPAVTGYHLKDDAQKTVAGVVPAKNVTVDVIYAVNSYTLTIKYEFANGEKAKDTYTKDYAYGEGYSVETPAVEGYSASVSTVAGNMPADNKEVTVIYTPNSYPLTIEYKYADGKEAFGTHNENVVFNTTYEVKSPVIEGYTADTKTVSGTMDSVNGKKEVVTYNINSHNLTIHYVYADGTKAADDYVQSYKYNEKYDVATTPITGYNMSQDKVSGTMGDEDVNVNVVFSINSYTAVVNYYYVNNAGKEVFIKNATATKNYKEEYSFVTEAKEGYTADKAEVKGTMPAGNVTEKVVYTPNSYDLTVNYVYADGTKAADSVTKKVAYNDNFKVETPELTGYTADKKEVIGTMDSTNGIVETVVYEANKYDLTINYTYADGTKAADSYTDSVAYKSQYEVESPKVEGYHVVDEKLETVKGEMVAENVTVNVEYAINTYNVSYYVDGQLITTVKNVEYGTKIADLENPGLSYKVAEGYTFSGWKANVSENVVTVSADINVYATTEKIPEVAADEDVVVAPGKAPEVASDEEVVVAPEAPAPSKKVPEVAASEDVVQTGDSMNSMLYVGLLLTAVASMLSVAVVAKKKED